MKPVRWTVHAQKKAASREVNVAEAEKAIASPDSVVSGRPPRRILMRRYFDDVLQSEMLLRVVVEETEAETVLITLYKTLNFNKYEAAT